MKACIEYSLCEHRGFVFFIAISSVPGIVKLVIEISFNKRTVFNTKWLFIQHLIYAVGTWNLENENAVK